MLISDPRRLCVPSWPRREVAGGLMSGVKTQYRSWICRKERDDPAPASGEARELAKVSYIGLRNLTP